MTEPLALVVYWTANDTAKRSRKRESATVRTRIAHQFTDIRKRIVRPLTRATTATQTLGRVAIRRLSKGMRSGRRTVVRWIRVARYNVATRVLGRGAEKSGDMRP